ncbi:MAG: OmpA family protein [Proteobacteria bacterium]|nr:OmpA family protein [Desulfobulbaceae bacterium]MBU4152054.1 OmpA family protein [Pseudomonadota bacterium]
MAEDPPKQKKCPAGAPLWMCTFADMMSLLLCFFIILLSFSNMDEPSFVKLSGTMKDAFGAQKKKQITESSGELMISPSFESVPFDPRIELEEIIEQFAPANQVELAETSEGMVIRIKEQLAFDSGKAEIKPQFVELLDKIGKFVLTSEAETKVNGHTDNVIPQANTGFKNNWELSSARAVTVVEYWQKKFTIPSGQLIAAGLADGKPIISNITEEGRAKNRRVEFIIKLAKDGKAFSGIEELTK